MQTPRAPGHLVLGRRTVSASVLVLLACSALAACGGDDGDGSGAAEPSSSGAAGTSSSAGAEPSAAGSSGPVSASGVGGSSSAAPTAAGPTLTLDSLSLQAPAGWQLRKDGAPQAIAYDPTLAAGEGQLLVIDVASLSEDTLESTAKANLRAANQVADVRATRQPNRVLDGVEGYVLTGGYPGGRIKHYYEFGTVTDGHDVQIQVQFLLPYADADTMVEAILATVQWV